jgi:hypothetical protein
MKNVKDICREIAQAVRIEIESALDFNETSISKELVFGKASVIVETGYECKGGWMLPFTDVAVMHEDCMHTSPLLTAAIERELPKWDEVEREYEQQMEYCR